MKSEMSSSHTATISVIIPTYNRAHLVGRAICSVLEQTFRDFELIVVDDGSMDDTDKMIKRFDSPRIRYLRHERNRGGSAARNTGIEAARGEYIAFLDSDDKWLPLKLEKQIEVFRTSDLKYLGVVTCARTHADREGNSVWMPQERGWVFDSLLRRHHTVAWNTSTLMIKRTPCSADIRFDETLPAMQDYDYVLRLTRHYQLDFVGAVLVETYRDTNERIYQPKNVLPARLKILEKYSDELQTCPEGLSRHHLNVASAYRILGDVKSARRHFWLAFLAHRWTVISKLGVFLGRWVPRITRRIFHHGSLF